MIQKLALVAATLTAALVLAGGLALAGFGNTQSGAADMQVVDQVVAPVDVPAPPEPTVQVDTIYLTPVEKPQEITVTKVKVATRQGGEQENEGGDD